MRKKTIALFLSFIVFFICTCNYSLPAYAVTPTTDEIIYYTFIQDLTDYSASTQSTITTKTSSKTTYAYDSSGNALWYVKVIATFEYDGTTSYCKAASSSAGSCSSYWKISNKSCTRSGNSATATAVAKKYISGTVVQTLTKSVTISCSKNGTIT